ncbi:MAG TPA: two-component sensor histidine kinase, partial [Hellea balneolensis]|nr:two-component sensor histidine kinase [Hellea balneolensis]
LNLDIRKSAMRRALENLIGNACTYAEKVRIEAKRTGRHIVIAIDDDGPGIPPSQRSDALKPFVRLDPARNQNIKGVGLGLSISSDIIQAHGGTLTLEDSPLGGLRCLVILPL